jgi:hypothetical protein
MGAPWRGAADARTLEGQQEPAPVSHVTPSHAARATDHAVRRYLDPMQRLSLSSEAVPDPEALSRARAQGWDCHAVRRRLASLEGIILSAGMRDGVVVVPLERTLALTGGLTRPPVPTPTHAGPMVSPFSPMGGPSV